MTEWQHGIVARFPNGAMEVFRSVAEIATRWGAIPAEERKNNLQLQCENIQFRFEGNMLFLKNHKGEVRDIPMVEMDDEERKRFDNLRR